MDQLRETGEIIRPKILFTPNNSLTWRIIKRVSYHIITCNGGDNYLGLSVVLHIVLKGVL